MDGDYQAIQKGGNQSSGEVAQWRRIQHRLVIEAAIEEGYPLRIEQRLMTGRTSSRIARPVRVEPSDDEATGNEVLVTRTSDYGESRFAFAEVDNVSLVTTHLRPEEERRGGWSVGELVLEPHFGLGVVQAFRGTGSDEEVVVRFDAHGSKSIPLVGSGLRPVSEADGTVR